MCQSTVDKVAEAILNEFKAPLKDAEYRMAKAVIRVIGELLQDHYYDSLQHDKEMIMLHINAVLLKDK